MSLETQSLLNAVVEGTTDAIYLKDLSGCYRLINAAGARFIGKTVAEVVGKSDDELFPADIAAQTQANDWHVLSSGISHTYEDTEVIDGLPRTFLSTKDVCRDEEGRAIGLIGISRDVTERRAAEEAERSAARRREGDLALSLEEKIQDIQDNDARFRGVVEGLSEGILITDFEDVVLYASPRITEMTGWTAREMLGKPAYAFLLAPREWPTLHEGNQKRQEGISECWEACLLRNDGSTFWAENKAAPFRDATGRIVGTLGAITDISTRKALEAEQARLSQQMQLLLDSAGEGFFGIDLEGRNTFVNPAAATMLGYEVEELLGLAMHAVLHHTRADGSPYPREECPIYAAFTTGAVMRVTDEVFWRKDGTSFPVEYVSTPICEEDRLTGAVVTFRDITERLALEAEQTRRLAEAMDQADRDPLTGLWNHRAFHRRMEEEANRAQRGGTTLAVAMLDLNSFGFFNNAYGHIVGDRVLQSVAERLQRVLRSYDTIARYGGDEFALLLPIAADVTVLEVEARLQEGLKALSFRPDAATADIPLGISFGVALFPGDGLSRHEVLKLADDRLLRAKTGVSTETEADRVRRQMERSLDGFSMLDALVTAVDNKDRYTCRHSEDVLTYSLLITRELGLNQAFQETIASAALLHDVGKIGVPDGILRKPAKLTEEEFQAIRQHPVMGAAIVGTVSGLEETLPAVRHHHERWDGAGYPAGLRGEETPLIARIMAVADAFSAMTTDRPYRKGMAATKALMLLQEGAGTQWDPVCVEALVCAWPQVLTTEETAPEETAPEETAPEETAPRD